MMTPSCTRLHASSSRGFQSGSEGLFDSLRILNNVFTARPNSGTRQALLRPVTRRMPFTARADVGSPKHQVQTDGPILALDRRALLLGVASGVLLVPILPLAPADAAEITKVFVAGATGATGRRVVLEARRKGLQVRAGVRSVEKAQSLGLALDKGVELVTADVTGSPESLAAAIGDAQAVICAIGYNGLNPAGYDQIDRQGTINLVDGARLAGVSRFVMESSLLTNGAAVGQGLNPGYIVLQLFGGVLSKKLEAEKYLRSSGLEYVIVRPGGLSNEPASVIGNVVVRGEDTLFGRPSDPGTDISRETVAQVLVEAAVQDAPRNRVVEIVASPSVPLLPTEAWFADL